MAAIVALVPFAAVSAASACTGSVTASGASPAGSGASGFTARVANLTLARPSAHLVNPSFDGTTGWSESTTRGVLSLVPGRTGTAVRLSHTASWRYTVILNDARNTVSDTVAGASYTATAWVRASRATEVSIRLQEWSAGSKRGEVVSTATIGTGWTLIGVNYLAATSHASLDLNVLAPSLPPGASVDVDDVTFRARPLTWADDFAGRSLDTTAWTALNRSTFGDGNAELACLMNRPANLTVSSGALALVARRESTPLRCGDADRRFPSGRDYSSAFVQSTRAFTYGRFAVRAKLPTAQGVSQGLWPAFWMRPVGGGNGEIDVLEAVGSGTTASGTTDPDASREVHQSIHHDYSHLIAQQTTTVTLPSGTTDDGWHTYAVEWDPGRIQWFVDGRLTWTRTASTTPWLASTFDRPMFLRLNLAVGGTWPGSPDAATAWPATYLIDAVTVHGSPS